MLEIQGIVEDIIFRNESNGYTVGKLYTSEGSITFVGTAPFIYKDEPVQMVGDWIYHNKFGEQFQFSSIKTVTPSTTKGIENYLSSGLIPHIGPKTAKKIVDRFGEFSLEIIQYQPDKLLQIDGIGEKKLRRIMESYDEQREMRDIMVALSEYGISINQGMKIYKVYGNNTLNVIRENPYRLSEDIYGMGFRTADDIASKVGLTKDSPFRIEAGLKYVMMNAAGEGHCFLPKEELFRKTKSLLQSEEEGIEDGLKSLLLRKNFHIQKRDSDEIVYYMPYHTAENNVAKALVELSIGEREEISLDLDKGIEKIESSHEIAFGKKQKSAIKTALESGVTVITGGPGTGKTTIINAIIQLAEREGLVVVLAAPTGRAAKRITETTGKVAKTIHRLLEISFIDNDLEFSKGEENPIEGDIVIVDEVSMMDILLMNHLIKAIGPGTRLILVGDVDQLPSVGAGNVLRDIIDSRVISVVYLDEIFRQGEESMIIVNAHLINKGEHPLLNEKGKDFFHIQRENPLDIKETIIELVSTRLPEFYGLDGIRDIQVLSPMRKGEVGVLALNKELQNALNPKDKSKEEKVIGEDVYRVGDKVMQIKNNYQSRWVVREYGKVIEEGEGIFNGDIGYITDIDQEEGIVTVLFDDNKEVEYDLRQVDELKLSYATTIHKSQGSEFPCVILPLYGGPPMLLTRNLLYTAITRAKALVVLIGDRKYMYQMIKNNLITNRYSSLAPKISEYFHLVKNI